jgi:hypothetical protein
MIQKFVFEFSEEDGKKFLQLFEQLKQTLSITPTAPVVAEQELPVKREVICKDLKLSESCFFNLQRRGLINPVRMKGSRLTFYYKSEVLSGLQKFNPKKYA